MISEQDLAIVNSLKVTDLNSYKLLRDLLYMERKRRPEKRFYRPRQKTLHIDAKNLQDLEDGKFDFFGLLMSPRVGKSTICIFFLAWIIGKRPESHNTMSGHSGILTDRFYADVLKLTTSEEYMFSEIFPNVKAPKISSDKNELRYDEIESFATLTCRGVDIDRIVAGRCSLAVEGGVL